MTIGILASEYAGDRAWSDFAKAYGASDNEIVSVATAIMGSECAGWFGTSIPALGGRSPHDVLAREPRGEAIVRALIMRLP